MQLKPRNFSVEDEYFTADVIKNCQKLIVITITFVSITVTIADDIYNVQGKPKTKPISLTAGSHLQKARTNLRSVWHASMPFCSEHTCYGNRDLYTVHGATWRKSATRISRSTTATGI